MANMLKMKALLSKILRWAGLQYDWSEQDVNNTTDTWVPVFRGHKIQHRVIPAKVMSVVTATRSGTTNSDGAIFLDISNTVQILSVSVTSDTNMFGIPFKYNDNAWFADIVNWNGLTLQKNTNVTVKIYYSE